MDKKRLHHIWTKFRAVKPWYFLILLIISAGFSVYALRQNNLEMVHLRNAVFADDKNNGDVNAALKNLQAYVTTHMNTNLSGGPNAAYPPIQLQYTYARLQQANNQAAGANSTLYTDAENYCQQKIPTGFSGRYRISCIEQYIQSHGVAVQNIPVSLYEFDFVSPQWSPDLAGWSLVVSVIVLLLFLVSAGVRLWLKHYAK
ncbi:MAG TPA: hypothetical protein VMR28_03495 [Candidatus Saccharimonadales bacterium]|nr:hypothetical protein [Candidatus Saccharimonadales bacterium]